jgi:fluoroquinolone resistance protein
MEQDYIVDTIFENHKDNVERLAKGEYENCRFNNCDFSNGDLSGIRFTDCIFNGCNLSLAKLNQTSFRDTVFNYCKMLGLQFDTCATFGLSFRFENCILNHSTFYGTKIRKTFFKDSKLEETDFSQCDLSESAFVNCDLTHAIFDNTFLVKADFQTSVNYRIDPEKNRIKKAKFSLEGLPGLLQNYDIEIAR